jgi:hypothetical protein
MQRGLVRRIGFLLALAPLWLVSTPVHPATIGFDFVFADAPGVGFRDPIIGAPARAALRAAGRLWGERLLASHPGETITVRADFDIAARTALISGGHARSIGGALDSARLSGGGTLPGAFYPAALVNHLVGADTVLPGERHFGLPDTAVSRAGEEVFVSFDPETAWSFDGERRPDFLAISLHEIGHGLGFLSSATDTGAYRKATTQAYDNFLVNADGESLAAMTDAGRLEAVRRGVFWDGPAGIAANGGIRPRVLSGGAGIEVGSTLVHTMTGAVMDDPPGTNAVDPVTLGMLRDIGWTTVPLPAPAAEHAAALAALLALRYGLSAPSSRRRSPACAR